MNDKPAKVKLKYNGLSAYFVLVPTGRRLLVSSGEVVELLPNEAEALKGSADWSVAPKAKKLTDSEGV